MGDPAGIGPEIIVRALGSGKPPRERIVIVGYRTYIERAADLCSIPIEKVLNDSVELIEPTFPVRDDIRIGQVHPDAGDAAAQSIITATELAKADKVDGIVTAPINKKSLRAAGYRWPGHTEMLRDLTGTDKVVMMLAARELRVALVTTHMRLLDAIQSVKTEDVVECAEITASSLAKYFTINRPRLVLAAINPHAGEGGMFGNEEADILTPAVRELQTRGIDIEGPLSADALFVRAAEGEWDAVIATYHDQGLIPLKLHARGRAVNITFGLPIIRTSVGHGTAFDIAGTGRANESSLVEAIKTAASMAQIRKQHLANQA